MPRECRELEQQNLELTAQPAALKQRTEKRRMRGTQLFCLCHAVCDRDRRCFSRRQEEDWSGGRISGPASDLQHVQHQSQLRSGNRCSPRGYELPDAHSKAQW